MGSVSPPAGHGERIADERRFGRFDFLAPVDLPRQSVGVGAKPRGPTSG